MIAPIINQNQIARNKLADKINEIIAELNPILQERDSQIKVYEETMKIVKENMRPKTTYNVATGEMEEPENIYTKTCRMEKEFAEEELERTRKALKIAIEALETVRRYTAINQFKPKSREAYAVAKKAVADIKAMIGK